MDRNLLENNYKKANNQLFHIDCRKSRLKKEIYSLYDLYLKIIRFNLQNYLEEALKVLLDVPGNGLIIKDQKTVLFIKNDLKNLVNKVLPFLTIEQLSIKKKYKIFSQIKNNSEFKSNFNLIEEIFDTKNPETIYTNNSANYFNVYYEDLIYEENFKDINLDSFILESKYFYDYKEAEGLGLINTSILFKDCEEDKSSINIQKNEKSKYFCPIEFKDILLWIDTLESSLNLYLKDLSNEINNELIEKHILKRFINKDFLLHIIENHLLFSNPSPFVLTFDPSLNQYINFDEFYKEDNSSKISLININSAELEFKNINLSILKNKLLEVKNNIYKLIKKENYWFNKLKVNSNIKSTINKF